MITYWIQNVVEKCEFRFLEVFWKVEEKKKCGIPVPKTYGDCSQAKGVKKENSSVE